MYNVLYSVRFHNNTFDVLIVIIKLSLLHSVSNRSKLDKGIESMSQTLIYQSLYLFNTVS